MINTDKVRQDFPILTKPESLVYFDNACMSLKPIQVINAVVGYYQNMSACAGRSNHRLASAVSTSVEESRKTVAKFISAKEPSEVIFTRNTTESINLVAQSLELLPGDVIIIGDKEHNSNLVPWLRLKQTKGIEVRIVPSTENNEFDIHAFEQSLHGPVKLVSISFTSNLDGATNPIREIAKLAHRAGAVVLTDAAQAAPHQVVNVSELDVDFLAFSVHKLCGPTGMGILYGKKSLLEKLSPFMVGGDTVEKTSYDSYTMLPVPEKFEAGLQDYAGIIGTQAAVSYLSQLGMKSIHEHETNLTVYLTQKLSSFQRIHILGPKDPENRGGITSFTVDGADHHQVALMLDNVGKIMVRSGQHCVHSWFRDKKITGSVRASLYFYNTKAEIDAFISTLEQVLAVI